MIFLIILVAIILRLINIDQSFWLDEAINVNNVAKLSFKELFFDYSLGDFHPPFYHLLLKTWTLVFPISEVTARLLPSILGVGTVIVTYLLGKKLFEQKTGLIAAALIATSPLHVYYSQEARMYMLAAFLASLSVYFFIILIKKENIRLWIGFILTTTLMLYTDYVPYLMIPVYILFLTIFRKRFNNSLLWGFLPAFLIIFILLIPWLIIFPQQLKIGLSAAAASPAWAQVVGASNLQNLVITFVKFTIGRISHDNNIIYALFFAPVAAFTVLMFVMSLLRISVFRSFLWFWFFVPIILAFAIAFIVPIYSYFRLVFVLPALYLIWASAINTINVKKFMMIFFAVALFINLVSLAIYYLNPKFQRENWKDAVSYIHREATSDTIVLFESAHSVAPFDYYNKNKIETAGALTDFSAKRKNVKNNVESLTQGKNHIFLFQYLTGITDPSGILFEEITMQGFSNVSTEDFSGVGFVYEFKR